MGIGSWLSRYIKGSLLDVFINIEILVGLVGGLSAPVLFLTYPFIASFSLLLFSFVVLTGVLVGLEIPLLMRILKDELDFNDLVSKVFTVDYIGALLASLIFPMVLVPHLGLLRTSLFFGILNALVGVIICIVFKDSILNYRKLLVFSISVVLVLVGLFANSDRMQNWSEEGQFEERIILSASSPYQRIVLTGHDGVQRLFLNGNLQFSSLDEYRYHEALVHPALAIKPQSRKKILVLGGGDGMAVRELLKYPTIESIVLVDLDSKMTALFKENARLVQLNDSAFHSPKVKVINADAFEWIKSDTNTFDLVIIDFPDPSSFSLGKLYTTTFFHKLKQRMSSNCVGVIQSTSPMFARQSFWCVVHTMQSQQYETWPYHVYVPSFGEWGFILFSKETVLSPPTYFREDARFMSAEQFKHASQFPPDMSEVKTGINQLNNQQLVHYFEQEWSKYTP